MGQIFSTNAKMRATVPLKKLTEMVLPVMYVGVGVLNKGDILRVTSILQTTNDNDFTVAWNSFITLNDNGIQLFNKVGYSSGRNLLRDIHHDGVTLAKII